jgi:NDP-sugar pyrophosphorylase family protein
LRVTEFDEIVVSIYIIVRSQFGRALGDGSQFGVKLDYVEEPVILGTSGALDNAREFSSATKRLSSRNGKIITDIDLRQGFRNASRDTSAGDASP